MKEYSFKNYKEFTTPNWWNSAVYYIKNTVNNKQYIGSSTVVGTRINISDASTRFQLEWYGN